MQKTNDTDQIDSTDDLLHRLLHTLRVDRLDLWSSKLSGFPALDLHLLKILAARPEAFVGEIKLAIGIPNSTLTSAINRLEKRGIIRRRINHDDLRSYRIVMTAAGRLVQEEHDRVDRSIAAMMLEPLDATERKLLIHALEKVVAYWQDIHPDTLTKDEKVR